MQKLIGKAKLLVKETLPYINKFKGKIVVIKYGGKAMINEDLKKSVMNDILFLKEIGIKPIIIHGGGPMVTKEMEKAKVKPVFVDGLRVTDGKTIKIIDNVFEKINLDIKNILKDFNVEAKNTKNCIIAKKKNKQLGYVGEITKIKTKKIQDIMNKGKIPLISPIGVNESEKIFNVNADTAAVKIASASKAEKLTIMTNVDGVIEKNKLISQLSKKEAVKHIKKGVITKGMIPKVKAGIEAIESGVNKVHLINGTIQHSLLFEIFTDKGIGTEIVKNGK